MSSDLKVTNIKHASSGSNNLVLGSDGSATIANGTLSAGTIGGNVVFPAGKVLQVKSHNTTQGVNTSSSSTRYLQSDGTWDTGATSPWGNLTTKKANSTLVFTATTNPYFHRNTVSGNFADVNFYILTSSDSGLSGASTTNTIFTVYEDCRSSNYVSGQQQNSGAGQIAVTTSFASGTTVYYTIKVVLRQSGVFGVTALTAMEVAT